MPFCATLTKTRSFAEELSVPVEIVEGEDDDDEIEDLDPVGTFIDGKPTSHALTLCPVAWHFAQALGATTPKLRAFHMMAQDLCAIPGGISSLSLS